jgi:HK97 family phage major capsid protein
LWEQSSQLDVPSRILGVPIEEAPELASSVVANAEPIVYGDFRQGYLKVNNNGTRIFRDETTDWPNVGYRSKMRVGGGVVLGEALKILKVKA